MPCSSMGLIEMMVNPKDSSVEEISQKTTQSKNSVAVQLHRGLEKLKVLYQEASDATLLVRKDMTSLRIGKGI